MKKWVLACVILCMLLSVPAMAEAADVAGTWYLTEIDIEGSIITPEDLGVQTTLELNADGGAVMDTQGLDTPPKGTWTADGGAITVILDGESYACTVADGVLSMTAEEDMCMRFSREQPEVSAFVPAAAVDAPVEDFEGSWIAVKMEMDGMVYNSSILGSDISAVIEGTEIKLDGYLFNNKSLELTYADGAMTQSGIDDASGERVGLTVRILEDGMLAVTLEAGESTGALVFYMERVD